MIPSLFVAHGSPMVAIERSAYGDFLDNFGRTFPRPKAIVVFSAHWESPVQMVSEVEAYSTLYDFGGFPEALYRVKYPAKGDRELSRQIQGLLAAEGITYGVEKERGLDHGSWTILHRMYPAADIPVIAMSVNADLTPAEQFRMGNALSSLRADDILIVGRPTNADLYPYNLPAWRGLAKLKFRRPITFFVGENGSGKSTLLEAIAIVAGFNHGNSHTRVHAQDILFAASTFPQEFSVVSQLRR